MNVLNKQSQGTRKNGLSVSKSGNAYKTGSVYGNSQTIDGGGHEHNHYTYSTSMSGGEYPQVGAEHSSNSPNHSGTTYGGGGHSHTFTPSITDNIGVTDNISVSLGNGDTETRPLNYTTKYWKRIA